MQISDLCAALTPDNYCISFKQAHGNEFPSHRQLSLFIRESCCRRPEEVSACESANICISSVHLTC